MAENEKRTEILVGTFVALGLALLGGLILTFGSLGDLFADKYAITVTFPSASGIADGTQVRLGGAKIGIVDGKPALNDTFDGVVVRLAIYDGVLIPSDSAIKVSTEGLLGDGFIEIEPPAERGGENLPMDGSARVIGESGGGLSAITDVAASVSQKALVVMDDARVTLAKLNASLEKISDGVLAEPNIDAFSDALARLNVSLTRLDEAFLSETNAENLNATLKNLRTASEDVAAGTKKLEPVLEEVRVAVAKAGPVLDKVGQTADSFDETAKSLTAVADELRTGDGLGSALLSDSELRLELEALIRNLRAHGILFYKDRSGLPEADGAGGGGGRDEGRRLTSPPRWR